MKTAAFCFAISLCGPIQAADIVADDTMAGILADGIYSRTKDPTSLRFTSLGTPDGESWCIVYSATNSFNARITSQFYFNNRTNAGSSSAVEFNRHCTRALRKNYADLMNATVLATRKRLGLP